MAAAPWAENATKVVVEFVRGGSGTRRHISLKHSPAVLPPQLNGRVSPENWAAFMADVQVGKAFIGAVVGGTRHVDLRGACV